MCNECHLHDQFRTHLGIKNPAKDHGDRESEEPHGIDGPQLNRIQVELCTKLSENAGANTKRKRRGDESKATA